MTGIYKRSQLKDNIKFKNIFHDHKRCSITLYNQILDEPNADRIAERILLLFTDERGVYKRTYSKRFEEFDAFVIERIQETFDPGTTLTLHDFGVSDARTSVDFFHRIAAFYRDFIFDASDYDPAVHVIESGRMKLTINSRGRLLEIVWPPFVFNKMKRDSLIKYPLNYLLCLFATRFLARPLLRKHGSGQIKSERICLFAPVALRLEKTDARFHLMQQDLLSPINEAVHIIRAMNILNRSYFSDAEIVTIMRNIHSELLDGGLFVTGSNQDSNTIVNGAIFQKQVDRFVKQWSFGQGSPFEAEIMSFRTA